MSDVDDVLQAYGASPDVLDEFDCVPLFARIVRDGVKLRTATGARWFKKAALSPEQLSYVNEVVEHVYAQGFRPVPRFIRNRYGDPYVIHRSGQYYMTTWFSGRESDPSKLADLVAGARLLARFHQSAREVNHNAALPHGRSWADRLQSAEQRWRIELAQAESTDSPSPRQKLLRATKEMLMNYMEQALYAAEQAGVILLEQQCEEQGMVCHGSFEQQSLRFDGLGYVVLGFDAVHPGVQVYDLAMWLHRYMPMYAWDVDVLRQTVSAYQSDLRLRDEELEALYAYLSAPINSLNIVSQSSHRSNNWDDDEFVDALEESLLLEEQRSVARTTWWSDLSGRLLNTSVPSRGLDIMHAASTQSLCDATKPATTSPVSQATRTRRHTEQTVRRTHQTFCSSAPGLRILGEPLGRADKHSGKHDEEQ